MRASVAHASPGLWLLAIVGVAFAVRSVGAGDVFLADGTVALAVDDASYHARLVYWDARHFPARLAFDPLLNHPDGARVPWPGFYDGVFGAVGWALGATPDALDRILAWASPVLGSLTVIPVYFAARALLPVAFALLAAAIYALLPIGVIYSRVGDPDHHAWLAWLAAWYLALSLGRARAMARAPVAWSVAAIAIRVLVVLSWSGSLLYLAVGEGALALSALLARDRAALRLQSIGCAATSALVLPFVVFGFEPLGGWFSAYALSGLQVLFLAGTAAIAEVWLALDRVRPTASPVVSLLRAAALAAAALVLCVAISPVVRAGLAPALAYLGADEGFLGNPEQFPLYRFMRSGYQNTLAGSFYYYGALAYVLPVGWLAAVASLRDDARRSASLVLSLWSFVLGGLAVYQLRWGNDFAPAASIGFALAAAIALRAVRARSAAWRFATMAVCASLLLSLLAVHGLKIERALQRSRLAAPRETPTVALVRFAQRVRDAVNAAEPAADVGARRAILASPGYGHVLHRVAGLALPADNFGPQFDPDRYGRVLAFFGAGSQERAMSLFRDFEVGWLMTDRAGQRNPKLAAVRLHEDDGSARRGSPAFDHFRLATEADAGAPTLAGVMGSDPPYKLFQWVEGARIRVAAAPGSVATARVTVATPWGRDFAWQTSDRADASGVAVLRVPYAGTPPGKAAPASGVRGVGPWRVFADGRELRVAVREEDVVSGNEVRALRADSRSD